MRSTTSSISGSKQDAEHCTGLEARRCPADGGYFEAGGDEFGHDITSQADVVSSVG